MPRKTFSTDFDMLSSYVQSLYTENTDSYKGVVPMQMQQQELELLKSTTGDERFFMVINLLNFEIEQSHGIAKWLGYSEKEFSLKKYWNSVVHETSKKALLLVSYEMYRLLCTGHFSLQFMVQRFSGQVVLKHYNGNYCLAKKTSSIFNFDKENRLLSYLDEFTIISRLSEEQLHDHAFNTRIFNTHGENEPEKQKEIMMNTMKRFLDMKIFSVKELQVARAVAYNPGITRARLASDFNVTVSTIDTYFSRFLEKARDFFIRDFPTVDAAAKYLREEGLV